MKLFELAKVANVDTKEVLAYLKEAGLPAKSHLSVLTDAQIQAIHSHFNLDEAANAAIQEEVEAQSARQFSDKDMINCRSVSANRVVYGSDRTGFLYDWQQFGQVVPVAYIDLLGMYSRQSPYLFAPLILIDDEDLFLQWRKKLEPLYLEWIGVSDPEDFFALPDEEFERIVRSAPAGMKSVLTTTAIRMLKANGDVTVRKLQVLDSVFDTSIRELYG